MNKKLFILGLLFAIVSSCVVAYYQEIKALDIDSLSIANIEALSGDEHATSSGQLDCSYKRVEVLCEANISAELKTKLLGFTIVKGEINGTISVYGNECESGGTFTCEPLRCDRYWEIMFGKN